MKRQIIAQLLAAEGKAVMEQPKLDHKKKPRPGWTYRGARRNAVRETKAVMLRRGAEVIDRSYAGSIELNRSQNWSRAKSYSYPREIGPSSEPVR